MRLLLSYHHIARIISVTKPVVARVVARAWESSPSHIRNYSSIVLFITTANYEIIPTQTNGHRKHEIIDTICIWLQCIDKHNSNALIHTLSSFHNLFICFHAKCFANRAIIIYLWINVKFIITTKTRNDTIDRLKLFLMEACVSGERWDGIREKKSSLS